MNEDKQSQNKKSLHSDVLKWVIAGLIGFVIIILIFSAGMWFGGSKAQFSYRWAENYHKNFAGPRSGFFSDWRSFPNGDFIEGHGAFGEIIELTDTGFIIKGRGDIEKIIVISDETTVRKGLETVEKSGLKVDDRVVIIGSPNEEGQIEAKLIRIFNGDSPKSLHKGSRFFFFK